MNCSVFDSVILIVSIINNIITNILPYHCYLMGGSRGLVVKVLDSKFEGCEFKTHTHYLAANEYKHCLEGTCDGLVSPSRRVSITAI